MTDLILARRLSDVYKRQVLDNARKHGALVTDYVLDVDDSAWIWDTDVACDCLLYTSQ